MILPALITVSVLGALYATRGPVARLEPGKKYYVRAMQSTPTFTRAQIQAQLSDLAEFGMTDVSLGEVTPRHVDLYFRWSGPAGADVISVREEFNRPDGPYAVLF